MALHYCIHNLHCRGCMVRIEEQVGQLPGVQSVAVEPSTKYLYIEGKDPGFEYINTLVEGIAPGAYITEVASTLDPVEPEKDHSIQWLWFGGTLFILGLLSKHIFYEYFPVFLVNIVFFGIPYLICGWSVLKKGIECLLLNDFFNEFTLMGGATIIAIIIGDFPEAVGVMFFYRVGEYIQEKVAGSSRKSIKALLATKPSIAHVIENEQIHDVDPISLQPGSKLLVKPGEKIPVDGVIEQGTSQVDTSPLTGESSPVIVQVGSQVFAGTINLIGSLTITVTAAYKDSSVSKILTLVENAVARKAPTERFITQLARYYTPIVVLASFIVALIPPLLGFGSFQEWIYRGLILMVISCPCALLISIPLGYFGGIGSASCRGILVKGGNVFDALHKIRIVAFDKTGTLTKANFTVTNVYTFGSHIQDDVLQAASIALSHSKHPIANAILDFIGYNGQTDNVEIQEFPGKGVIAKHNEDTIIAGNSILIKEHGFDPIFVVDPCSFVHVIKNNSYLGVICVADMLKPDAAEAIRYVKKYVHKVAMLTGDRKETAQYVAEVLGVDEYQAELLPEDKVSAVENLGPSEQVLFVGDGINDTPALALSGVGVAMGSLGSDAAIEVADAVILDDSPVRVGELIQISYRTRRIILQNITLALGVKAIIMAFGVIGLSSLWEAVFADVGVTILAVLNASRVRYTSYNK